ncbi:hypothetical protein RJ641_000008, partial [Dillenia turbinata]
MVGLQRAENSLSGPQGVHNLFNLISKRIRIQGFLQRDFLHLFLVFQRTLSVTANKERSCTFEDMDESLQSAPTTFAGLFSGKNRILLALSFPIQRLDHAKFVRNKVVAKKVEKLQQKGKIEPSIFLNPSKQQDNTACHVNFPDETPDQLIYCCSIFTGSVHNNSLMINKSSEQIGPYNIITDTKTGDCYGSQNITRLFTSKVIVWSETSTALARKMVAISRTSLLAAVFTAIFINISSRSANGNEFKVKLQSPETQKAINLVSNKSSWCIDTIYMPGKFGKYHKRRGKLAQELTSWKLWSPSVNDIQEISTTTRGRETPKAQLNDGSTAAQDNQPQGWQPDTNPREEAQIARQFQALHNRVSDFDGKELFQQPLYGVKHAFQVSMDMEEYSKRVDQHEVREEVLQLLEDFSDVAEDLPNTLSPIHSIQQAIDLNCQRLSACQITSMERAELKRQADELHLR